MQQYAAGTVSAELAGGLLSLAVSTDYPHRGEVRFTVTAAPAGAATVSLRIPSWAAGATARVDGAVTAGVPGSYLDLDREWLVGESILLDLPLAVRLSAADPRVDGVRGCLAIERGPLVYCLEQTDQAADADFAGLRIDAGAALGARTAASDTLGGTVIITVAGTSQGAPVDLTAIPYALWANREPGSMRVWIPTT